MCWGDVKRQVERVRERERREREEKKERGSCVRLAGTCTSKHNLSKPTCTYSFIQYRHIGKNTNVLSYCCKSFVMFFL